MLGGAMYALERGLGMKWLGIIFAVWAPYILWNRMRRPGQAPFPVL